MPAILVNTPVLVHIECIGVSILLPNNKNLTFVSAYCPKGDAALEEIDSLLYLFDNSYIVGGDFNAHHGMWGTVRTNNKSGCSIFQHLTANINMVLCTPTNFLTRLDPITNIHSTIDLTFASSDVAHLINM